MRYVAPAWLPGSHPQTIYPALFAPRPRLAYRRARWETPDRDFIDLDWVERPPGSARRDSGDAALVVLFHGLEGSSQSHYALALMRTVRDMSCSGVVVHFRGCSGEPNRLARAYHSGDSAEVEWILRRLKEEYPASRIYAVGVSLGGNALLKWLGERGSAARPIVDRACAVSAPVDLMASGNALERGFNRVYARHFLFTMKKKALAKLDRFPGLFDGERVRAARTLREFDDVVTAPLHGFLDADDYWTRASSKPLLANIAVPTLMINARNDPFLPSRALPGPAQVSPAITLEFPADGGHVGFVAGVFPGSLEWLPRRAIEFFARA